MQAASGDLPNPAGEPTRLAKVVAALVPCSRRDAEAYITQGRVRVDGRVVEEPQFRVAGQKVEVDSRSALQPPVPATFLLHKPAGMNLAAAEAALEATRRWEGDPTGIRRVKGHLAGLAPLLPLPTPAEGLCVFSQDGRIVRKLREDAHLLEQELLADVVGTLAPGGLGRLEQGLAYQGQRLPPARVSWQSEHRLRIAAKGLPLDLLPWMCEQVGLRLQALRRMRIGRIPMAGLPVGQWRYLGPQERF